MSVGVFINANGKTANIVTLFTTSQYCEYYSKAIFNFLSGDITNMTILISNLPNEKRDPFIGGRTMKPKVNAQRAGILEGKR